MGRRITRMAGKARRRLSKRASKKPDLVDDSTTKLLLADAAILAGSQILRRTVERGLLKDLDANAAAKDRPTSKKLGQIIVSFGLTKLATRSLPGALIVGGGVAAKLLFDRRQARRNKRKQAAQGLPPQQGSDEQS